MILAVDIRSIQSTKLTGVGRYLASILASFARIADPRIEQYVFFRYGHSGIDTDKFDFPKNSRFVTINLPSKMMNALWMLSLGPRFSAAMKRIDYVWLPNLGTYNLSPSIPYALTVHDVSFLKRPRFYSIKSRAWHAMTRFRSLMHRAKKIIAVSNTTRDDLIESFPNIPPGVIRVIYPGVTHFSSSSHDILKIRTIYRLPENYILYIGTVEPRKNIFSILKAFQIVKSTQPAVSLVIVGNISPSMKHRLVRMVPGTIILGYIPDEDIGSIIRLAKIFVWPSFWEGFGFPPLEALTYGTRVIASYRTSLPEILTKYATYVNPYNFHELAHAIICTLQAPVQRPDRTHLDRYQWDRCTRELIDYLCE